MVSLLKSLQFRNMMMLGTLSIFFWGCASTGDNAASDDSLAESNTAESNANNGEQSNSAEGAAGNTAEDAVGNTAEGNQANVAEENTAQMSNTNVEQNEAEPAPIAEPQAEGFVNVNQGFGASSGTRVVRYTIADGTQVLTAASATAAVVTSFPQGVPLVVEITGDWAKIADGRYVRVAALSEAIVPRSRQPNPWLPQHTQAMAVSSAE